MQAVAETAGIVFYLTLCVWIGGGVALGALVAPVLFRRLNDRALAGDIFGLILRRDARLRVAVFVILVIATMVRYPVWGSRASAPVDAWLMYRWAALGVMGLTLLLQLTWLYPGVEALRHALREQLAQPDEPAGIHAERSPERLRFDQLHKLSELTMKVSLLAAVALLISA